MSSSRRVKKGPGRRPLSAKRQQFMSLRERGWSIRAAAREIGISRTTANNWSRGYKVYRRGQLVGFVPALERLAVRQISPRFLSQDERIEIADLRHAGLSIRQIACRLGRAPSTMSRELRRNATTTGVTGRSMPTAARPRVAPATTGDASRANQRTRDRWSPSFWRSGGVRSRSAATCAEVPRAAGDVVVSREHLSGRLSAGIGIAAATPLAPHHDPRCGRARSPPRPSAHRTAPAPV